MWKEILIVLYAGKVLGTSKSRKPSKSSKSSHDFDDFDGFDDFNHFDNFDGGIRYEGSQSSYTSGRSWNQISACHQVSP